MKLRVFLSISIVSFLGSCMTTEPVVNNASVEKIEQGKQYDDFAVNYALPRTVINVKVVAEKTITKPGPFAAYAEKYLGVTNVPTREKNVWNISSVQLTTHGEKDPGQTYRINTEGVSRANRIQLDREGVLLGVNLTPEITIKPKVNDIYLNDAGELVIPGYSDITLRKNTEPMMDTSYRTVRTDTSFIRIPVLKEQISKKSLMNQAEEAADVIMMIRDRRYKLLNGEIAFELDLLPLPSGEALEVMIRELAILEYDYVSLFVGRTHTEESEYEFSFTPGNNGMKESKDLFSFSTFSGVLPAGNSNGDPVKIVIDPFTDFPGSQDDVSIGYDDDSPKGKGIAYRIPGKADVAVTMSGKEFVSDSFLIAQFGIIQFLPKQLLAQPDLMIRFHPELGNLEGIYEK